MIRRRYATIKDIAQALQISVSTVSRALRDTHDVNADTRRLVLAKAAELNYKPNFNATGLVRNSTHNLGVIIPGITNYYFSTVFTGIQEVAYEHGYNIILYVTNDSPERELSMVRNLSLSSLDGLLVSLSSPANACRHFQEVIDDGVPVVFFDRVTELINTSRVMQDDYNGAYAATAHLLQNGYRRIAHISGPAGLALTDKRLQGYLDALKRHGMQVNPEWIIHSGFSQESGEQDVERLFSGKQPPDAVFAVNDRKAVGVILALQQRQIAVGREVGVVGFTNDPISTIISPQLTTVAEPAYEIGKISCELLLKHIQKKHVAPESVMLPARLMVRASSGRKVS